MAESGEIVGIGFAISRLTTHKKGDPDMHASAVALHELLDARYRGVNPTADGYKGNTDDVPGQIAGIEKAVKHLLDSRMKYPNCAEELDRLTVLLSPDEQAKRRDARTAKPKDEPAEPVAGEKPDGAGRDNKPGAAVGPGSRSKRSRSDSVGG